MKTTWKYRFLIWKNSQLQQLFCCPSCVTTSESHHDLSFEYCKVVAEITSLGFLEMLHFGWVKIWNLGESFWHILLYYGDWVHCEFFMILDFYGKPAKFTGFPFRNVFEWLNDSYGPSTQTSGIGEVGGSFHDPRWWGRWYDTETPELEFDPSFLKVGKRMGFPNMFFSRRLSFWIVNNDGGGGDDDDKKSFQKSVSLFTKPRYTTLDFDEFMRFLQNYEVQLFFLTNFWELLFADITRHVFVFFAVLPMVHMPHQFTSWPHGCETLQNQFIRFHKHKHKKWITSQDLVAKIVLSDFSQRDYITCWVVPPPSNSGKWRFIGIPY